MKITTIKNFEKQVQLWRATKPDSTDMRLLRAIDDEGNTTFQFEINGAGVSIKAYVSRQDLKKLLNLELDGLPF